MTPQEQLLKVSVETVQSRLCMDFGTIFAESMDVCSEPTSNDAAERCLREAISNWRERIVALILHLDWPTWLHCEQACDSGSVCSMRTWPISFKVHSNQSTNRPVARVWTCGFVGFQAGPNTIARVKIRKCIRHIRGRRRILQLESKHIWTHTSLEKPVNLPSPFGSYSQIGRI